MQEAFERLLGEAESRPERRQPNIAIETEAAELVALARRLGQLRAVEAPARLRQRALRGALHPTPKPSRVIPLSSWRLRPAWTLQLSRMAASIAVVGVLGYGAVAASAQSLPDSPLYPLKLIVEDVLVFVAPPEQKPGLRVAQLERRLEETEAFVSVGRIAEAVPVLEGAARRLEQAQHTALQSSRPQEMQAAINSTVEQRRGTIESFQQRGGDPPAALARAAVPAVQQPAPSVSSAPVPAPPQPVPVPAEVGAEFSGAFAAPASASGFEPITRTSGTTGGAAVDSSAARVPAVPAAAAAPAGSFVPIGGSDTQRPAAAPAGSFVPIGGNESQQPAAAPAAPVAPPGANNSTQPAASSPTASPTATTAAAGENPPAVMEAPTGGFKSISGGLPSPNRTAHDSLKPATGQ